MKKVFLSHSSADKAYVENVAKKIGLDNCIFDKYTFEDGMKTLDEIYKGLDDTDIFVFFISDKSLASSWVEKERKQAKALLGDSILRFYPIIIDSGITYNDRRIPKWMQKEYNIRYIAAPTIAANKIKSRMREIVWKQDSRLKSKNTLFIGRNDEVGSFETRRADFDKQELRCLVASSAFLGIGRKAYMSHVLKKSSVMGETYNYNLITLERHESIEDFVLKISDLGTGYADVVSMSSMSLDEKIHLAADLIKEVQEHNEFIFVNDQGVLIKPNNEMVEWFERVLQQIPPKIVICIASIYYLNTRNAAESVFSVRIPELEQNERRLLLKEWCALNDLTLSVEQMKTIATNLSGYPEQVFYAVQMIKDDGIGKTMTQLPDIAAYADDKSQIILDRYADTEEKKDFLVFLSSFEFVGYEILETVYKEHANYKDYMDLFLSVSICELMGSDGEYIRVNDVLRDVIFRRKLTMGKKLEGIYKSLINCTVDGDFISQTDLAGYYNTVKAKLETGEVDERYIVPSHYIKCIIDQYNRRKYDKSTKLCKKLVDGGRLQNYDTELVYEIYYFYCLSLAREHNGEEFHKIIKYENFKQEDKAFLYGFFYRINGNPQKAISHLNEALGIRRNFPKARRELANAYINSENFEAAFKLCVENYNDDERNPYYIQPYFETLIHQYINAGSGVEENDTKSELKSIMEKLLNTIEQIDTPQAKPMRICMQAEFAAYVSKSFEASMNVISEGLSQGDDSSIYPYMTQFDIAYKYKENGVMETTIHKLEEIVKNQKYFSNALNLRKARYYAAIGKKGEAASALGKVKNMPENTMEKLRAEVEE